MLGLPTPIVEHVVNWNSVAVDFLWIFVPAFSLIVGVVVTMRIGLAFLHSVERSIEAKRWKADHLTAPARKAGGWFSNWRERRRNNIIG